MTSALTFVINILKGHSLTLVTVYSTHLSKITYESKFHINITIIFKIFYKDLICLFDTKRECQRAQVRGRAKGEAEGEAGSPMSREPDTGLHPRTPRS